MYLDRRRTDDGERPLPLTSDTPRSSAERECRPKCLGAALTGAGSARYDGLAALQRLARLGGTRRASRPRGRGTLGRKSGDRWREGDTCHFYMKPLCRAGDKQEPER